MNPDTSAAGQKFQRLVEIMSRLRAPGGCPWDREQTFDTIKPYLLEESYEVMEAIDDRDWHGLAGELGDLLLQSVFFAEMAAEAGHFTIEDSLEAINSKLIRRHPHVFGEGDARTADDVKKRWDEIKAEERKEKGVERKSLLDGIPRHAPALAEAAQISSRAAGVGFDWDNVDQVYDKLREELDELAKAQTQDEREHELGDILFVIVNIARFLRVDPEQAMRKSNARFRKRFAHVEAKLAERGRAPQQSDIVEMEALWQEAKKQE